VSPGAVTDGVTCFYLKKVTTFFQSSSYTVTTRALSTFLPDNLVYPVFLFFVNSGAKIHSHSGVTPLDGVTVGGPPQPLNTSLFQP